MANKHFLGHPDPKCEDCAGNGLIEGKITVREGKITGVQHPQHCECMFTGEPRVGPSPSLGPWQENADPNCKDCGGSGLENGKIKNFGALYMWGGEPDYCPCVYRKELAA